MNNRKATAWLACLLAVAMMVACAAPAAVSPAGGQAQSSAGTEDTGASTAATAVAVTVAQTVAAQAGATSAAAASANEQNAAAEQTWDEAQAVAITLNGTSIAVQGQGVTVSGSTATITSVGTYVLSGSLADGQVIVNVPGKQTVTLVLNGVNMHSATGSPIWVMDADQVVLVLADGTENFVSDAQSYLLPSPDDDEPNAAVFSKADLTITGYGSLTVEGNYNDGITSKDGLVIRSGTIAVNAVDDGIRGKDYIIIEDGNITVTTQGDGFKADNAEDATKGYISIERGRIRITCGGDAVQAETAVRIQDGEFVLIAGGGHNARIPADLSAKGIKAGVNLTINGGTFDIDAADDALHSNDSMVINGGTFVLATGDDALHADATLEINGGSFRITTSYEGLESATMTINGGEIYIKSSDDGINVAAGQDGSGTTWPQGAAPGGRPGRGGGPGQDAFDYSADRYLHINGGYIVVDSGGDGIDVNGNIEMTDGVVIVHGPTRQMDAALDCIGTFNVHGGLLVAVGSAGMAEAPDASSTQNALLLNLSGTLQAGVLFHIRSSDGKEILTFAPSKAYQSIAFSSPDLQRGVTYDVYYGGSATGTMKDGLYESGTYTPGTELGSFSVSGIVTVLGSRTRFR